MKKKVLIVRVDAIGDYILFRNFISSIEESNLYCDYEIYMLCHFSWVELSRHLDKNYIQEFFSFDSMKYREDSWYRHSLEINLKKYNFDTIIHSAYSRTYLVDTLINRIKAEHKIAYDCDLSNISLEQKSKSDKFYTKLIKSNDKYLFEFDRNKFFFEALLEKKIDIDRTEIECQKFIELPFDNYVVFVIGANHKKRKWSLDNYILAAKQLYSVGYDIVLCGHYEELDDAMYFQKYYGNNYIDLVSKTSLVDMLSILKKSEFVLSNDTGLAHMSIALEKQTFIISNGNHFGRFMPYPKEYDQYVQCIFPFDYKKNFRFYCERYYKNSDLDINLVQAASLLDKLQINKKVNHNKSIYNNFKTIQDPMNLSLHFSQKFNIFYKQIIMLEEDILIYGYGTVGKTIQALIPERIVAFLDHTSDLISEDIIRGKVYNPKNLENMKYDKIIISVLGREDEIVKYLVEELHVSQDKIIIFNI